MPGGRAKLERHAPVQHFFSLYPERPAVQRGVLLFRPQEPVGRLVELGSRRGRVTHRRTASQYSARASRPSVLDRALGRFEDRGDPPMGPSLRLRSPRVLGHVLRAPGELGIGRGYVCGDLEIDDLDSTAGLLGRWRPPPTARRPRCLLSPLTRDRASSLDCLPLPSCDRASATPRAATPSRCATTTTSRTSSSHCSSTSR